MIDTSKIMAAELAVYYEEDDTFMEASIGDKLYSMGAKFVAFIKRIVISMKAFASEISVTLQSGALSIKIHAMMEKAKREVSKGKSVHFPDIEFITKEFKGVIHHMRKKVNEIGKDFDRWINFRDRRVKLHIKHKEKAVEELDELLEKFNAAIQDKYVTIAAEEASKLGPKMISHAERYISDYVALVDDLNHLAIRLEKNAALSELDYELRTAVKDQMTMIGRIKNNATKTLRCGVFAVCVVTGI